MNLYLPKNLSETNLFFLLDLHNMHVQNQLYILYYLFLQVFETSREPFKNQTAKGASDRGGSPETTKVME